MPDPILRLRAIKKTYGGVNALRGIDFDLFPGEVHALVGENGAGKSTLIKVITGAHRPDSGELIVAGQRETGLDPANARRLGIACIYQQPALFPDLTVAENIALRLAPLKGLRRIDWKARNESAGRLLQEIGASISPRREVGRLSMPEQQLVEIACYAFGAGAKIVLMDEPTASLTQSEQKLLFSIIGKLRAAGTSIIYISHRLEEILVLADRVTVLRDGERVGTYAASEVNEPMLVRLMVGREMSQIYPSKDSVAGDVVLAVREVGCRASGVKGVSLEARAGEVLGLAGLIGSGRTEFARILFGLTPADSGEIFLRGRRVRLQSPEDAMAEGVAYVPEDRRRHGVVLEMSVAENTTMAVQRVLFPGSWLRRAAEAELAADYIRGLAIKTSGPGEPVKNLSGGNQQKVSLARWLATHPKLLILDEPTQGVDIGTKSEVHKMVRQLARQGMAILLISSDLPEILGMSDRIGVMRRGSLAAVFPGTVNAPTVMAAALGLGPDGVAA